MSHKFRTGDKVRVDVKDKSMSHFTTGFIGTLGYSYKQKYGGGVQESKEWCVKVPKEGWVAWYYSSQFTLVKAATDKDELRVRRELDKEDRD